MFFLMLVLGLLLLGIFVISLAAFTLSFTKLRYSWMVLACALPAFAVGAFYTIGFLLARRPFSPWFLIFWLLLVFGSFSIFRWFWKRP
jgi:hypothetical protein